MKHGFSVGSGKASKSIPNNTWVCDHHKRFFRPLVILQYIGITLLVVCFLGGCLAFLKEVIELSAVNFFVSVGPGVALFVGVRTYAKLFAPKKKLEYVTETKGSAGTVWRDTGWM